MKKKEDGISAGIIAASLLLCVLMSVFAVLGSRDSLPETVPVGAPVMLRPESSAPPERTPAREAEQLPDPLLVLVNEWNPLPENWQFFPGLIDDEVVDLRMYDSLTEMFSAAAKEEVWFWVASGYRSPEQQEAILARAVRENEERGMAPEEARQEALRTIQRSGCSEHHTGLAVDLNDVSEAFEKSEAYRWLSLHAAEYGFVQRYKREKAELTGIDNESWHYRYVGREHALEMERLGFCLEEYVQYLLDLGQAEGAETHSAE